MKKKLFALVLVFSMLITCAVPAFAVGTASDSDITTSGTDISGTDVSDTDISDTDVSDSDVSDSDVIIVDVKAVFDAVTAVENALSGSDLDVLKTALDELYDEEVDMFNEMDENQLAELAEMKGCSSEEVFYWVLGIAINANVVIETADIYDAFMADQSVDNANAYVSQYIALFDDPDYVDEELRALVRKFIPRIDEGFKEASKPKYIRVAGGSRTETAVAISSTSYEETYAVVLASGDEYADALVGVPFAHLIGAPILLIRNSTLDDATLAEIERLGASEVYILGGELAISAEVEEYFVEKEFYVERLAGATRFDTAVAIAERYMELVGETSEVFFAYSHNYPDALAVSSIAAINYNPILYIGADGVLSESTAEFIASNSDIQNATILGGTIAVSADAEKNIQKAGIDYVRRIAGASRYDTCLEINKEYADVLSGYSVVIATGKAFPDALAGGVLAALCESPMVLVGDSLTDAQIEYLTDKAAINTYFLGGKLAISDEVVEQIMQLAK